MIKFIKKHYYVIIFSLVLILFLPGTISLPALTNTRAIITGLSIDKEDQEYTIALQLITPQSDISNNENLEIIEDTGATIFECFNNLSIKLGKVVGLEHTNIIILSDSLKNDDIMNLFDYLYRNAKITMSTIVVQTDNNAKKLLETSAELNNNSSSSLQNNLGFNNSIIETSNITSLGTFFNDYFSYSGVSLLPYIELPKEDEEGSNGDASASNNSSSEGEKAESGSSGTSSSGGSAVQPLVQNNGKSTIYRKGKYVDTVSSELSTGFSWLDADTYRGNIKVENVSDNKYYYNSTITVKVEDSKRRTKTKIKENNLILDINIDAYCFVSEIIDINGRTGKIMQINQNYLSKELISKIQDNIIKSINNSLNYCKKNKIDAFKLYDKFYKYNKKGLKKVLSVYGENYLDAVEFNISVNIHPFK